MPWTPPEHDRATPLREQLSLEGWRAAIEEIGRRHGIGGAPLAPFATGSDVVWSAGEWVVKLTAPCWRREIEAEARCLGLAHERLSVCTPEPLAVGELEGWPYVVMRRVPGVALGSIWRSLGRAERLRLAAALGRLTLELHAIDPGDGHGGWDEFWRACRRDVARRHAHPSVPPSLASEIEPFLESAAAAGMLASDERALIHTELLGEHVLVEERAGRCELSALIDFADARAGPSDYEFAAPVEFLFRGEPGLLCAYLTAYGLEPSELTPERSQRMLAWYLCHRFSRLSRLLAASAPARPARLSDLAHTFFGLG